MSAFSVGILFTASRPWISQYNVAEGASRLVQETTIPERITISDQYKNQWIVDKDDKLWPEVLEKWKAGERTIVLPLAYITENRGWGWWTAFEKQIAWLSETGIHMENKQEALVGLNEAPMDTLSAYLMEFGSFLGYLEAQVGVLLGRHVALKEGYESGLNVAMSKLGKEAGTTIKEKEGHVLATNTLLRQTRYQLIEAEVLLETARKHRDAYKVWWDTCSRLISIRIGEMNFAAKDRQP